MFKENPYHLATLPLNNWSGKILQFKHFSLPYTLFEAFGAVFITHSKINLRKICLNEYFNAILHYFGVNLLSGLTADISSFLGLRFSWEPNAMQFPTDLLTSLSREIIIRSLFYLLADLVLASHADVLRGVVFPPPTNSCLPKSSIPFPLFYLHGNSSARLQPHSVSLAWRLDREMRRRLIVHETGFTH